MIRAKDGLVVQEREPDSQVAEWLRYWGPAGVRFMARSGLDSQAAVLHLFDLGVVINGALEQTLSLLATLGNPR